MTDYRAQYKISQDAIRKYADDVRRLETEVKEKERIIKNLKKVVGEVNRPEYEAFGCQHNGCDKPISKRYDTYCTEHDTGEQI